MQNKSECKQNIFSHLQLISERTSNWINATAESNTRNLSNRSQSILRCPINSGYRQPGFFMFRNLLLIIAAMTVSAAFLSAQTPVEKVILKYENASGARNFIAQGLKMALARNLLKSTQVGPVASDVDQLYVLKMEGTSQAERLRFVSDLNEALKQYDYYGRQPSKNGEVDVYVHYTGPDTVDELVIYNPEIYSLNSLFGHFTAQELLALDNK